MFWLSGDVFVGLEAAIFGRICHSRLMEKCPSVISDKYKSSGRKISRGVFKGVFLVQGLQDWDGLHRRLFGSLPQRQGEKDARGPHPRR